MLRAKNAQQRIADPLPECPAQKREEASHCALRSGLALSVGEFEKQMINSKIF